jgi:hypothetical protein
LASQINASNSGFGGIVSTGDSSGQLQLQTAGTTALTLDTSQNATFAGKVTSAGALTLASNGTTTALTIDTSQNVLIGATSASGFDSGADNLIVGGGSGSTGMTIYSGTAGVGGINFADGTTGSAIYAGGVNYNHSNNSMSFYTTDGTGRMFINSSGNVGIGINTQDTRLVVSANIGTAVQRIFNLVGTNTYQMSFHNSTQECGTITTGNNTVGYNSNSDYRLKDNVIPMTGALDKIAKLKPVTYTWKASGTNGQGFIAHELQEHFPDAVSGEKDAVNEDGKPVHQGVDTSFLVATLTAAIQELTARVIALENK